MVTQGGFRLVVQGRLDQSAKPGTFGTQGITDDFLKRRVAGTDDLLMVQKGDQFGKDERRCQSRRATCAAFAMSREACESDQRR